MLTEATGVDCCKKCFRMFGYNKWDGKIFLRAAKKVLHLFSIILTRFNLTVSTTLNFASKCCILFCENVKKTERQKGNSG